MQSFVRQRCAWFACLVLGAGVVGGCEDDPAITSETHPHAHSELTRATALSRHYVELEFSGGAPASALDATRYFVVDPDGGVLAVLAARAFGDGVVLVTRPQRAVEYRLVFDEAGAAAEGPVATHTHALHAGINFSGSTLEENHLVAAIATDNTHVVLAFKSKIDASAANPIRYTIQSPNLTVLAAELSEDREAILLTTSPQEALTYTVRAIWLHDDSGNKKLIDPFRSSAQFDGRLGRDTAAPALLRAAAVTNTSVLLTFSEALSPDAIDLRNFAIAPDLLITAAQLRSFDTQLFLETTPMTAGVTYTVTAGPNVRDVARNPVNPAANSATFSSPLVTDGTTQPVVVGAVSTGNTGVLVRFSRPMDDSAIGGNYAIVQENEHSEAAYVGVLGAAFTDDRRVAVQLTTQSQSDVTYRVMVSNVADITGNPLAPRMISQGVVIDPTSAVFAGTPPNEREGTLVDSDGDGLTDNRELRGWVVTVLGPGGDPRSYEVTSDPYDPDTDRDGLSDAVEFQLRSDPRAVDTDGDTLSDEEEFNSLYTDQNAVDSDGDGIDDQLEVEFFKTNALQADSDGDGFDDDEELFERGRDPRIADLPEYQVEVGTVQLRIDERFSYTDEEGLTVTQASNTSTVFVTGESSSTLTMDGATRSVSGGAEFGLDTCQDSCGSITSSQFVNRLFAKGHIEAGADFLEQTDTESARASERAFESSMEKGREFTTASSVTRDLVGASVQVEVTLRNPSSVAITVTNVVLTLYTTDPEDTSKLVPVATLLPESVLLGDDSPEINIGPGESRGPMLFANHEVYPNVVEDLMRSPRGFVTRVANYDLVTGDGRNFAFGLQAVRERTVGLLIDDGGGVVRRIQAIAAGVLNRPRDELRCASYGPNADRLCVDDADCGASAPCVGGQIVGGFAGFEGTGPVRGVPLDFVLQDTAGLRRSRPQVITAGDDGVADSVALGDDVQVIPVGTAGLGPDDVVVASGRDLRLASAALGDDLDSTLPDGILAGADGVANSVARGDDVQLVPVGTRGVPDDTIVVSAGEDGVLDSAPRGDDVSDIVTGYEVSSTCDGDTPYRILVGVNGVAETNATAGTCARAFAPHFRGERCVVDADCGSDPNSAEVGVCTADVQGVAVPNGGARDDVVVAPGASGFLSSVPLGDDIFLGPGTPCTTDEDCHATGLFGGACAGPQKVVRVGGRRDGQFQRYWTLLLPDNVQFQTDFSLIQVRTGDVIGLKFVQDVDRDGLIAEEEFLAGSSDFKRDTDDDTLDDFAEVRVGWDVGVVGGAIRRVYSDPRSADSDADGLFDFEEFDFRPLQCACDAVGPKLHIGSSGTPCSTNAECGGGICRDAAHCSPGQPCPSCTTDVSRSRTDPRLRDTDSDGVRDDEEVFSFLTGAGVGDSAYARVILAGPDRTANTLACPQNRCADDPARHCDTDGDCRGRQCLRPVACDDVQVVPFGSGGWGPRTVVVAPGILYADGLLASTLDTAPLGDDVVQNGSDRVGTSQAVGDDILFVGVGESALAGALAQGECVDGSTFGGGVVDRFDLCGLIKPGPDGVLQSQPAGDDVVVPSGYGQRREFTDPLNPDTDMDELRDGFERLVGSSPTDAGDTGDAGDLDSDGLTDMQEAGGYTITVRPVFGPAVNRLVASNPYVADTDRDGLPDYAERHMPCDDVPGTECPTDPSNADTDGDGITDYDEISAAKFDQLEAVNGFFVGYLVDGSASAKLGTNPSAADTDGDQLSDFAELFVPVTVALEDGSRRQVTTDPTLSDSDGDGASDRVELTRAGGATDPTDPDTDDDEKLDGREIAAGSDPRVPDLLVTVTFRRIEIDSIEDTGGADDPDFGWYFLLRAPGLALNPTLVSSAAKFGADDIDTDGDGFTDAPGPDLRLVFTLSGGGGQCLFIPTPANQHHTLVLNQGRTFPLKEGEAFVVEGLLAEFDPGTTPDCGRAPNYVPTGLSSACYTRFSETYNFSDLAVGDIGETLAINPVDGQAAGGDSCAWQVIGEIRIE